MPRRPKLVLGKDYIIDRDGRSVFTAEFLLGLGACCGNDCRNCPYPCGQQPGDRCCAPEQAEARQQPHGHQGA